MNVTKIAVAIAALTACVQGLAETLAAPPLLSYHVVAEHPHDPQAYTEGLLFASGQLYESTGLLGHSTIRKVDLQSGRVIQSDTLSDAVFGEGLALCRGRFFQLTWTTQIGYVYDLGLHLLSQFSYSGEGWGLTCDGAQLIMSNGSPVLQYMDTDTHRITKTLTVTNRGQPMRQLNELEYVEGHIFANIWMTDLIAQIDPITGVIQGWLDLSRLRDHFSVVPGWDVHENVPNGIAYDPATKHLFVTGKRWPKLFEISLD